MSDIGNNCVCCNKDTSFGSGRFVNRIPADAEYESLDELNEVYGKEFEDLDEVSDYTSVIPVRKLNSKTWEYEDGGFIVRDW